MSRPEHAAVTDTDLRKAIAYVAIQRRRVMPLAYDGNFTLAFVGGPVVLVSAQRVFLEARFMLLDIHSSVKAGMIARVRDHVTTDLIIRIVSTAFSAQKGKQLVFFDMEPDGIAHVAQLCDEAVRGGVP